MMEYNDYDFLMILSIYAKPLPLRELLAHVEPSGEVDEAAYFDGMWLAAQMEQDYLIRTSGEQEDLTLELTEKGRDLCDRIATAMAEDVETQWRRMQAYFTHAA